MERNQEDELSKINVKFGENLTLESSNSSSSLTNNHEIKHDDDNDNDNENVHVIDDDEEEEDDDDDGEFEFSFASGEFHSPVSADEAFYNGQIRPIFAFSDDSPAPVKRMFVVSAAGEEDDEAAEGEYCAWSPATAPAPAEMSRKSNSTGFSRLWRMKDLLVRSNSDGKDTFVFLPSKEAAEKKNKKKVVNLGRNNNEGKTTSSSTTNVGGERKEKKGKKKAVTTASMAAYEALYGNNKEKRKGGGGNRSYLPYRQDLVGFFTNVNGFTRNVHPY